MLPFEEWWELVREWVHRGEWRKLRISAGKRLEERQREAAPERRESCPLDR
jgi:hypothetical protein